MLECDFNNRREHKCEQFILKNYLLEQSVTISVTADESVRTAN